MRAVVYARVSSDQQRERQTIQSQLTALPRFVEAQGWTLVKPADHYVDDGFSAGAGKLAKRDALRRLMADARAGAFDVVVVIDIDRLTRSDDLQERGEILGAFQRAGVQIAEASSGTVHDLNSSFGDLMASFRAIFAAEERRKIAERTSRGKARALAKGRKAYGHTPYGLSYAVDTGEWSLHPEEARVVREIFERVAAGESCKAVGRDLARRDIAPPRAGNWAFSIWRLIASTTYRGRWVAHRAKRVTLDVPPIVDDALWYAAQAAVARGALRGLRRTRHVYLLERVAICGLCGAPIWVHACRTVNRDGTVWSRTYYTCKRRRLPPTDGSPRCDLPMFDVEDVDGRLWAELVAFFARTGWAEQILGVARRDETHESRSWERDLAGYRDRLARLEAAEAAILERFTRGLISETSMDAHVRRVAAERAMLEQQIRTADTAARSSRRTVRDADEVLAALGDIRARLPNASPVDRRDLVRALVPGVGRHVVTVGRDGGIDARLALTGRAPAIAQGITASTVHGDTIENAGEIRILA